MNVKTAIDLDELSALQNIKRCINKPSSVDVIKNFYIKANHLNMEVESLNSFTKWWMVQKKTQMRAFALLQTHKFYVYHLSHIFSIR